MKSYNQFINEKVQADFEDKNPDFYLNAIRKRNKEDSSKKDESLLSKIDYKDIKVTQIENKIRFDVKTHLYFEMDKDRIRISDTKYLWKLVLATILNLNSKISLNFYSYDNFKNDVNEIFKHLTDYYALYYYKVVPNDFDIYVLFLTKDSKKYSSMLKTCKDKKHKVLYYNNKVKGREYFDIEGIKKSADVNLLKKVNKDDIYFKKVDKKAGTHHDIDKHVLYFKDENLDQLYIKLSRGMRMEFDEARESQTENELFGSEIGHRFHVSLGLPECLKGIGLGYKIYKAFIRYIGYICSNSQVSTSAINIYSKLINDDDFYTIIDKGTSNQVKWSERTRSRIMIIDKNYKYIPELIKLVKKRENEERKSKQVSYDYDKELNAFLPKTNQPVKPVQAVKPLQPVQPVKKSMFDFFKKKQ